MSQENQSIIEKFIDKYASIISLFVTGIMSIIFLPFIIIGYILSMLPFIIMIGLFFGLPIIAIWSITYLLFL